MPESNDGKIPLGLCKQLVMKFDSAITDLHEICEDPDLEDFDRADFQKMVELLQTMSAVTLAIISKEMDEEMFMREEIDMDEITPFPEVETDIMDTVIG